MIQENTTFFEKMAACFGDLFLFSQQIEQIANLAQIALDQFQIDHLAVRMNTIETAQQWRMLLEQHGELLTENQVNGRPICLFSLKQAVNFLGQTVNVIELPFPKGKTYLTEGWEHIEIVVAMQEAESVEQWITRCLTQFKLVENEALKIKISQPLVMGENLPNPTIAISLKNATYCNPYCLKLHPYDIKQIVHSENFI
ncbi:VOC family protein [[Haemophilus] ducreyi]|uniref:VOC family protein n=1 Tax=Haemophilus ducreyi TaxID=730 RepID=UPI000654C53C|nr:VOC family protein [[Haemophilus] ducreyi]AKO44893.1 hypothetical protein RZ66_00925 [[Haemophilus] ducreyi]AKO46299.1 hypothetical protein RZ67_00910 [[Haemophilus] ducreyi]AKO47642.1 hypothetical protein RZ68_00920 [[Haemophilus] ducreyi]AKO49023.1 hypothetical protein RZ69_00915 [[Haemophilus] ducreyi]ANF61791.1 metalloprotein [[Haemophilus] ducreyi]